MGGYIGVYIVLGLDWGYMEIMEYKMETTIWGLGFRVFRPRKIAVATESRSTGHPAVAVKLQRGACLEGQGDLVIMEKKMATTIYRV